MFHFAPHVPFICPSRAKPNAYFFINFQVCVHRCLLTFQHVFLWFTERLSDTKSTLFATLGFLKYLPFKLSSLSFFHPPYSSCLSYQQYIVAGFIFHDSFMHLYRYCRECPSCALFSRCWSRIWENLKPQCNMTDAMRMNMMWTWPVLVCSDNWSNLCPLH